LKVFPLVRKVFRPQLQDEEIQVDLNRIMVYVLSLEGQNELSRESRSDPLGTTQNFPFGFASLLVSAIVIVMVMVMVWNDHALWHFI
jgi:hypothetical protein